jgi:subtilisin-like proprotein convertase family protein
VKRSALRARIALMVVVALLALPGAQLAPQVAAKPQPRPITRTFNNSNDIQLPLPNTKVGEPVSALLYPSAIQVSGMPGKVRDVNLTLNNFNHTYPREVEVLLVGPGGQTAVLMAWVGGGEDIAGVNLRLDDEAQAPLPELEDIELQSGAYWPVNGSSGIIEFNTPAPPVTRANAGLAIFDGTDPNGTWRLFVQDRYALAEIGAFNGGWELEIQTQVKARKKR